MTQPAAAARPAVQPPQYFNENRKAEATVGTVATAIALLINPITGAAVGTYFITSIATNIATDLLGPTNNNLLGKVLKIALSSILGLGAALGMLVLLGAAVTLTPAFYGCVISVVALQILMTIASHREPIRF